HLLWRHLRDRCRNRLVREAIDAGPEGTLRTSTANRIVDPLFVRAPNDPVVAQSVPDPLSAPPAPHFRCDHRINSDIARVGIPRAHRVGSLLSGATQMPTTSLVARRLSGP